jgi:hypothetical protein
MFNIDLKSLTINLVIAYVISWGLFFLCLPFATGILGKMVGSVVLYAISWLVFIGVIAFFERDTIAYLSQLAGLAKNIVQL